MDIYVVFIAVYCIYLRKKLRSVEEKIYLFSCIAYRKEKCPSKTSLYPSSKEAPLYYCRQRAGKWGQLAINGQRRQYISTSSENSIRRGRERGAYVCHSRMYQSEEKKKTVFHMHINLSAEPNVARKQQQQQQQHRELGDPSLLV